MQRIVESKYNAMHCQNQCVHYFEVNPIPAQFLFLNLVFSVSVVIATNYSWNVHARKQ